MGTQSLYRFARRRVVISEDGVKGKIIKRHTSIDRMAQYKIETSSGNHFWFYEYQLKPVP